MKIKLFSYSVAFIFAFQIMTLAATEKNSLLLSGHEECNIQDSLQCNTASAGIDCGFVVGASFLYQQGLIDHLASVKTISQSPENLQPGESLKIDTKIDNLNYKWKPGVRANLGYVFSQRDQLSVNFTWTHLNGEGVISTTFDDPTFTLGSLKPAWFPLLLGPLADKANAKWNCELNLLDGTFGKKFFLGKMLCNSSLWWSKRCVD